jgi:methionyl-tRNA synthetase
VRTPPFAWIGWLLQLLLLGLTVSSPVVASSAQLPQVVPLPSSPNQPPPSEDPNREKAEKAMARRANQEREAQLKRDTERLFKLATELKDYVDKSNENTLSLDVIKKAEEIEKLAHSVKEKMKGN